MKFLISSYNNFINNVSRQSQGKDEYSNQSASLISFARNDSSDCEIVSFTSFMNNDKKDLPIFSCNRKSKGRSFLLNNNEDTQPFL